MEKNTETLILGKLDDLNKIVTNIEIQQQKFLSEMTFTSEKVKHLDEFVNGDGSDGAKVRLDRIEKSHEDRKRILNGAMGVIGVLVIKEIWRTFIEFFKK